MSISKKLLQAAAGNAGGESLYVEDVFSTYLYEGGNGSGTNQAVNVVNGVNLNEEGGLIWLKRRDVGNEHALIDTERGNAQWLNSNSTAAAVSVTAIDSFNTDGFTVSSTGYGESNNYNGIYVSWTFRKAEKFFDVVTYSGDGTNGREIPHSLAGDVGMVIVKCTSDADKWLVWHKNTPTGYLRLDGTGALVTSFAQFKFGNGTTTVNPTSSVFTVAGDSDINGSGRTYVAYLFASDAGGFGDDENIIKCGSYTGTGAAGNEVNLGFEPQWLMFKRTDSTSDWSMFDVMRGIATGGNDARLRAQGTDVENEFNYVDVTSTGFSLSYGGADMNASGGNYIYIAIRRPMKTPESGTEVFDVVENIYPTENVAPGWRSSFTVDMTMNRRTGSTEEMAVTSRLQGGRYAVTNSTYQEQAGTYVYNFGYQTGAHDYLDNGGLNYAYMFKRATGFFDVVAYTGDGSTGTINHNLGVTPEMIIVKARQATTSDEWYVYHAGTWGDDGSDVFRISTQGAEYTNGYFASTAPTADYFKVGSSLHASGIGFISYLFASLDGVSKVGTFTPSASSDTNVDCGFSAGARFVLIKSSVSGTWYIWDSARGIVAGNDPYLALNSTAAEVTIRDWIDPLSSGFTITSSYVGSTASANKHIFLAIA